MMKGYKVFNPDFTCRGFQYEVGNTYEHEGGLALCGGGFHFCRKAVDCFDYYAFDSRNKVAEVEALGLIESDDRKSVTNKIHIIRELTWHEVLELVNTGKSCTGNLNSGNLNSGNRNSGDWNSGVFCTDNPKIKMFDIYTNMTMSEWRNSKASNILRWNFELATWIYSKNMSEKEKKENPEHESLGGYLKVFEYKEACINMWNNLTEEEKEEIKSIPNFNPEKFHSITGIRV